MDFNFRKRFFIRGPAKHKTTLSMTDPMFQGLKFISDQTGQSVPEVIVEALEQYLTHLANMKAIPFPEDIVETVMELKLDSNADKSGGEKPKKKIS